MRVPNNAVLALLSLVLGGASAPLLFAQQSLFDQPIPQSTQVRTSLDLARRLALKDSLTSSEILQIYFAEINIGRFVWAIPDSQAEEYQCPSLQRRDGVSDTTTSDECVLYVRQYRSRFEVVFDGWKGDNNFIEPNRFWLTRAVTFYPDSIQTSNIEFDLDFKKFIRTIDIDPGAKGKTCQQHIDQVLKDGRDIYLEVYSNEEIDRWPAECDSAREYFVRERDRLLRIYNYAPFTKILQDIDPTTIVVFHSVC